MLTLVTGLGGFLGGALGRLLLDRGFSLRTLSRRPLPQWQERGVEVILGGLEDRLACFEACRGVEQVYHVAAKAGIWGSFREYFASNVEGTRNIVEACWAHRVSRLIHTSSPSAVFDGHDCRGCDETLPYPDNFLNYYSESKAAAEKLVLAANGRQGLATVALRPHLIWGPGDPHIWPRVLALADQGRLRQVGPGSNRVDITYVDNAVAAHWQAGQGLCPSSAQAGKAYFISDGRPVLLWEWVGQILRETGRPPLRGQLSLAQTRLLGGLLEWLYRTFRLPGEPPMTRFAACQLGTDHFYDIGAARRDFGYEPPVDFAEAMQRTLSHFQG